MMNDQKLPLPPVDEVSPNATPLRTEVFWRRLKQMGLVEVTTRAGSVALSLLLIVVVTLVMGRFYVGSAGNPTLSEADLLAQQAALTPQAELPALVSLPGADVSGLSRAASLHTILPSRGRTAMQSYTVQAGDTLFSIAERFGLLPETILWGNRYTLGEDPHTIYPGQVLNILPLDGVIHKWSAGEGLNGVAGFYNVEPEVIIDYELNGLSRATIGEYNDPNITEGTMLIIPGGKGVFTDWRTPRITRDEPARANYVGAGACSGTLDGISGTLNFRWPANETYLSGYDFSPETNHFGIDIAGKLGDPVYAADSGVVVYAGWNDWGYGEMIVIDHGFGWQTLYAHLSVVNVGCGQEVYQGNIIGQIGSTGTSTGPHLHFEIRSDEYGRMNPWDILQ